VPYRQASAHRHNFEVSPPAKELYRDILGVAVDENILASVIRAEVEKLL